MIRLHHIFLALALLAGSQLAGAHFAMPQPVPVERLLRSAEAYLAAHRDLPAAHYTLARIHYLAFAAGSDTVPALREADEDGAPVLPGDWMTGFDLYEARKRRAEELALQDVKERGPRVPTEKQSAFDEARGKRARQLEEQNWRPKGDLAGAEMLSHATTAAAEFREAMKLDPRNGLYPLGFACLAEQFALWAVEKKITKPPAEARGLTLSAAREAYLQAFRLAIVGDAQLPELPTSGVASLVSHEAGTAYTRLVDRDRPKPTTAEMAALGEVKEGMKKLKKLRMGAITPIIFSLQPAARIGDLLAPHRRVNFDLRGYGPRESWPWVKPATALLVWDPDSRGIITSARQLFGSYTFEIFRRDGYAALAALDDNGDGELRGDELRGLRAWFDSNTDGRSEPGEVHDLCEFGIEAIAVNATGSEGPHLTNSRGLTLSDGRSLPTWDWVVEGTIKPVDDGDTPPRAPFQ